MTTVTVPDVSSKIYEIDFDPKTITSDTRKKLFEFYLLACTFADQVEIDSISQSCSDYEEATLKSIGKFNYLKNSIEDFVTSN